MTKKHFVALAAGIRGIGDPKARAEAAAVVARVALDSNPRFDSARFYSACDLAAVSSVCGVTLPKAA